mmetsp:Transcript_28897/g.53091  ORF Transcript_28897/g.53091 Transcript_28897/m.53091 type:complete len:213 (-) Transcript_28897:980-1618(-)
MRRSCADLRLRLVVFASSGTQKRMSARRIAASGRDASEKRKSRIVRGSVRRHKNASWKSRRGSFRFDVCRKSLTARKHACKRNLREKKNKYVPLKPPGNALRWALAQQMAQGPSAALSPSQKEDTEVLAAALSQLIALPSKQACRRWIRAGRSDGRFMPSLQGPLLVFVLVHVKTQQAAAQQAAWHFLVCSVVFSHIPVPSLGMAKPHVPQG